MYVDADLEFWFSSEHPEGWSYPNVEMCVHREKIHEIPSDSDTGK